MTSLIMLNIKNDFVYFYIIQTFFFFESKNYFTNYDEFEIKI